MLDQEDLSPQKQEAEKKHLEITWICSGEITLKDLQGVTGTAGKQRLWPTKCKYAGLEAPSRWVCRLLTEYKFALLCDPKHGRCTENVLVWFYDHHLRYLVPGYRKATQEDRRDFPHPTTSMPLDKNDNPTKDDNRTFHQKTIFKLKKLNKDKWCSSAKKKNEVSVIVRRTSPQDWAGYLHTVAKNTVMDMMRSGTLCRQCYFFERRSGWCEEEKKPVAEVRSGGESWYPCFKFRKGSVSIASHVPDPEDLYLRREKQQLMEKAVARIKTLLLAAIHGTPQFHPSRLSHERWLGIVHVWLVGECDVGKGYDSQSVAGKLGITEEAYKEEKARLKAYLKKCTRTDADLARIMLDLKDYKRVDSGLDQSRFVSACEVAEGSTVTGLPSGEDSDERSY